MDTRIFNSTINDDPPDLNTLKFIFSEVYGFAQDQNSPYYLSKVIKDSKDPQLEPIDISNFSISQFGILIGLCNSFCLDLEKKLVPIAQPSKNDPSVSNVKLDFTQIKISGLSNLVLTDSQYKPGPKIPDITSIGNNNYDVAFYAKLSNFSIEGKVAFTVCCCTPTSPSSFTCDDKVPTTNQTFNADFQAQIGTANVNAKVIVTYSDSNPDIGIAFETILVILDKDQGYGPQNFNISCSNLASQSDPRRQISSVEEDQFNAAFVEAEPEKKQIIEQVNNYFKDTSLLKKLSDLIHDKIKEILNN